MYEPGRSYTQNELPSDIFNQSDGAIVNGYRVKNNGNGTRSFELAGGGANLEAYDNLIKGLPKATDFAKTLNAGEDSAFNDYVSYLKGSDSPLDFYTKASEAQGLPQLRKTQSSLQGQIYDLEDTLRRIEPDVSANSRNSVVTESQRRGIVAERSKPVIENLGWIGQSLGRVSDAVSSANQQALTLTDLNSRGQDRIADAYKTNIQIKSDQAARAMTGFSTDMQNMLTVSLAKISRGEQLSDQEAQRAFEALQMEKKYKMEFDQQMKLAEAQPETQIIDLGGRKVLINTRTGKEIAGFNEVRSGGSGALRPITDYYGSSSPSNSDWEIVSDTPQFSNILDYNNYRTFVRR